MSSPNEMEIRQDDVRREHMDEVHTLAHWAYLVVVLGGGLIVMVLLIALLGSGTGG